MNQEFKFIPTSQNCDAAAATGEIAKLTNAKFSGDDIVPVKASQLPKPEDFRAENCAFRPIDFNIHVTFSLKRDGYLAFADRFSVPESMCPSNLSQSAAAVHPSAIEEYANAKNAHGNILKALRQALSAQAESKGFFHSPFLARIAVRLTDGTSAWISEPQLIIPWKLPPRLEIASRIADANAQGMCLISLSSASVPYFSLEAKFASMPHEIAEKIAEIEVYATQQVPTYDTVSSCAAGAMSYQAAIADAAGVLRSNQDGPIYCGAWREADEADASDRFPNALELSSTVWSLTPNPSMSSTLQSQLSYHKIASVKPEDMSVTNRIVIRPTGTGEKDIKGKVALEQNLIDLLQLNPAFITRCINKGTHYAVTQNAVYKFAFANGAYGKPSLLIENVSLQVADIAGTLEGVAILMPYGIIVYENSKWTFVECRCDCAKIRYVVADNDLIIYDAAGAAAALYQIDKKSISTLSEDDASIITTRAFQLSNRRASVQGVALKGISLCNCQICLYGSSNPQHWRMCASAATSCISRVVATRHVFYRLRIEIGGNCTRVHGFELKCSDDNAKDNRTLSNIIH